MVVCTFSLEIILLVGHQIPKKKKNRKGNFRKKPIAEIAEIDAY